MKNNNMPLVYALSALSVLYTGAASAQDINATGLPTLNSIARMRPRPRIANLNGVNRLYS